MEDDFMAGISNGECAEIIGRYLSGVPAGGLSYMDFEDVVEVLMGVQECLAMTSSMALASLVTAALVGRGGRAAEEFYEVYLLVRSAQNGECRTKELNEMFQDTQMPVKTGSV